MLNFELLHNNVPQAVGKLWSKKVSIPMGGPFSAQSADLHTLWGVKKNGKRMKDWGNMSLSEDGYVFWTRGTMGAYRALCARCARAVRKVGRSPPPGVR